MFVTRLRRCLSWKQLLAVALQLLLLSQWPLQLPALRMAAEPAGPAESAALVLLDLRVLAVPCFVVSELGAVLRRLLLQLVAELLALLIQGQDLTVLLADCWRIQVHCLQVRRLELMMR